LSSTSPLGHLDDSAPDPTQTPPLLIPGYRHIQDTQPLIWLEGSGNYTLIYLKDTRHPLTVSQTLKYFERHLPGFIRVSKSALVNPVYIHQVVQVDAKTMHLELLDGLTIVVPRRRIVDTLARLEVTPGLLVQHKPIA
jgi:DNA-binding LytR/AlgR family response regulator